MEQYINKSVLFAEIEKLIDKGKYHSEYFCAYHDGNNSALYALKEIINTSEMKEVDLDKEWKEFLKDGDVGFKEIAKHFFELGLKAQKGE